MLDLSSHTQSSTLLASRHVQSIVSSSFISSGVHANSNEIGAGAGLTGEERDRQSHRQCHLRSRVLARR
eukprot:1297170-Pleurochrysis_carterae.AAC.2